MPTGWDSNRAMKEGAYYSGMTTLIVVSLVVLTSTLNLLTTFYATIAVMAVLVLVVGTVVASGWELGFLEAICFAILIGLSCDFVLHMAHAYSSSTQATRDGKSHDAISKMGPTIFAAAMTTTATGAVMFLCTITFFQRFGTILLLTMVYSIVIAVFFFLAATNLAGPTGDCCSLGPVVGSSTRPAGQRAGQQPPMEVLQC
jgi:predicted RND superfamily exporter protein